MYFGLKLSITRTRGCSASSAVALRDLEHADIATPTEFRQRPDRVRRLLDAEVLGPVG